jgi:hypothetical protein
MLLKLRQPHTFWKGTPPISLIKQSLAKAGLHDIWMAETRRQDEQAFDCFVRDPALGISRRWTSWSWIESPCWLFTIFRPSTGFTFAPPTRSNRALPRSGTAPPGSRIASPGIHYWACLPIRSDGGEKLTLAGRLQALARGGMRYPIPR